MAASAVDLGTGAAVTFSGWTAQITSMSWSGISRAAIDTSHLGSELGAGDEFGSMTFMPGDLVDPGSITLEGHFNPDVTPPIEGAAATLTLTFFTDGTTWAGSAFLTDFSFSVPFEDKMTYTGTWKFTGNITMTDD